MSTPFRQDEELLQRCLREHWITAAQAEAAWADIKHRRASGDLTPMATVLYAMGLLDPFRALALVQNTPLIGPPAQVGGYQLHDRLGAGGMGEVYRGIDPQGEEVAIKLIPVALRDSTEADKRFRREIRIGRRLRHPHIVSLLDAGKDGDRRWLAMALIHGQSLRQRIMKDSRLSEGEGMVLLIQMVLALRSAWSHRVLHRDIKPSNIMIAPPRPGCQEPFCAKLCDFGLAKAWHAGEDATEGSSLVDLTALGFSVGTPHYMSPEQALGMTDLDQRCDIYGLGATLFHCLTGTTVHKAADSRTILKEQATSPIDFTLLTQHGISSGLCTLLRGMLAKDRAQRLRDWDWILSELRTMAPTVVTTVETNAANQTESAQFPARAGFPLWWMGLIAGLATILAVIVWLLMG